MLTTIYKDEVDMPVDSITQIRYMNSLQVDSGTFSDILVHKTVGKFFGYIMEELQFQKNWQ